ncbi:MAG: ABC transporter permease subunit [Clostridia bacterium]|nr:ABC transporter permease subunit [Clostridia bacterium]
MKDFWKKTGKAICVLLFWIGVWALISWRVNRELLLPSPGAVLVRLFELAATRMFWRTLFSSLWKILLSISVSVLIGLFLALVTKRFSLLRALFSPMLSMIKSTPVASFIILALVWMGRSFVPVFICALMVIPIVWENVSAGISNTDRLLLEAAKVYRFSRGKTFQKVYFPSVMPYFLSACRSSMGLAWKAGIAAEVLTVPEHSIGKMIYESKLYLETTDLFVWTVTVILLSFLLEKSAMKLIGILGRRYNANEVTVNA